MRKKGGWVLTALLWIAALAIVAMLFFFSGQSAEESGSLSRAVTEFVLRLLPSLPLTMEQLHPIIRKLAHFSLFGLEGFLLGLALMRTLPRKRFGVAAAVIACTLMAVLNEYHQSFMDGRSCEVRDMIIDSAGSLTGIAVGAGLLLLIRRLCRRRRNVIIS